MSEIAAIKAQLDIQQRLLESIAAQLAQQSGEGLRPPSRLSPSRRSTGHPSTTCSEWRTENAMIKSASKLFAAEVYGSKARIQPPPRSDDDRTPTKSRCGGLLLMPESRLRRVWVTVVALLAVFCTAVIPYRTAFVPEWSMAWALGNFVVDLVFLLDILVNLRTAVRCSLTQEILTSQRAIFERYGRTWLVIDLLASMPLDWIVLGGLLFEDPQKEGLGARISAARLLRWLKLLRTARIVRMMGPLMERATQTLGESVMQCARVLFFMLLYAYLNACLQYLLATLDTTADGRVHLESWIVRAHLYCPSASMLSNTTAADASIDCAGFKLSPSLQLSWAYYHAISIMLGGIGIVKPQRDSEIYYNTASKLIGACIMTIFLGVTASLFNEWGAAGKIYRARRDQLHKYICQRRFPDELSRKLRMYFDLLYPNRMHVDVPFSLRSVSHCLQSEVTLHECRNALAAIRMHLPPGMAALMVANALEWIYFVEGDVIIWQNALPKGMYFIEKGEVEVILNLRQDPQPLPSDESTVVCVLTAGSFFGEMALLKSDGRSNSSVRVKTVFEGYHMSKERYEALIGDVPALKSAIEAIGHLRSMRAAESASTFEAGQSCDKMQPHSLHSRLSRGTRRVAVSMSRKSSQKSRQSYRRSSRESRWLYRKPSLESRGSRSSLAEDSAGPPDPDQCGLPTAQIREAPSTDECVESLPSPRFQSRRMPPRLPSRRRGQSVVPLPPA